MDEAALGRVVAVLARSTISPYRPETFGAVRDCRDGWCGLFGWDVESTLWLRWCFRSWELVDAGGDDR